MEKKEYWNNKIFKKYPEGMSMAQFEKGRIAGISSYNNNYYIGLERDLLFAESDDDNTTEWFLINGKRKPFYLGISLVTNEEKLIHVSNT